jgi:hypothetical protein
MSTTETMTTAETMTAADPREQAGGLRERAGDRLTVLRHELALGESRLHDLEREQAQLQQTVLRISGAILVLDELLAAP